MKAPFRRISAAAFLMTLAVAAIGFAQTPVDQESFSITLPAGFGEFARQTQTVKSENGDIQQVTYVSKGLQGNAVIVTHGTMGGKILEPAKMMESGRDSLIKSLGAKIESEKQLEIDGKPALSISFTAEKPRPIFARTDLVVAGPRMYQVIFLGSSAEALSAESTQVLFRSFDVKDPVIEKLEKDLAAAKVASSTSGQ